MASEMERNKIQLAWEEQYIRKVNFWRDADLAALQDRAAAKTAASSSASPEAQAAMTGNAPSTVVNLPPPGDYAWVTGDKILGHSGQAKKQVVAGEFALPSQLVTAQISGGKVTTSTMNRKEYTKARVIATEQSKAAGFMSISEEMFTWQSGAADENIFAPDFIPVLALIHSKISHLYPNGRVKANSGYRWWNETKTIEYSPHEAGCAIDIGNRDPDGKPNLTRGYQVADICWEIGLRGVFVGQTFVHVDIMPDGGGYKYDGVPMYRGPESH